MSMSSCFWKLYAAGLWNNPALLADFPKLSLPQWQFLLQKAEGIRVQGLVIDGITLLSKDLQPSEEFAEQCVMSMVKETRRHWDNNKVIADLFHRWNEVGVHPVLLKGQGYARMYERPFRRVIGDIDVFVCKKEWERAMEVVNSLPLDNEEMPDIGKHIEFFYRSKAVELHRYSAKLRHKPKSNEAYQEWSEAELSGSTAGFYINERGEYADEGEWITVPPQGFDIVYNFIHLWEHIYSCMPKVRALADWMLLLHHSHGSIDKVELEKRLRQFGLLRHWQAIGCFVVKYMGMNPDEMPFYDSKYEKAADRYLNFFNQNIVGLRPKVETGNFLVRKTKSMCNYLLNTRCTFGVLPTERVIKNILTTLYCGVRGVIKKN